MSKIVIGQNKCQILDEYNEDLIDGLKQELSFFVKGAEHSKAYLGYRKNGKDITWNGRKYLLTKNTLKFDLGLLSRVQEFYDSKNISYQLIDNRPPPDPAYPIDIIGKLKEQGKTPYPYQLETVEKAKEKSRGIIRIATGGGKSIVAALLVAALGKTAIIYVIGKDLLYQIHELFSSLFDQPIGIIGDGKCEVHDINVATIWTVGQALGLKVTRAEDEEEEKKIKPDKYKDIKDMLGRARVHILDECHLAACDTVQGIAKKIKPENVYGMSASPWRDDGADLLIEAFLGNRIVDIPARYLIDNDYLVEPIIKFLPSPKYTGRMGSKYKTIYKNYIVENEARNNMVLKGTEKLVEQGFKTLVLFHSLNHGKILHDKISKRIPCEILSGKDDSDRRKEVKDKLESGKINCIIASKIFDIGVDVPALSGLIAAGGGKSSVRALQRIGRVIRKYPGKEYSAVIDFADQAKFLFDHSCIRKEIYEEEFKVQWPGEEKE